MNQNYSGTDWILEVKEKEILKLLQAQITIDAYARRYYDTRSS